MWSKQNLNKRKWDPISITALPYKHLHDSNKIIAWNYILYSAPDQRLWLGSQIHEFSLLFSNNSYRIFIPDARYVGVRKLGFKIS